jgi:hypothetical protein
MYLGLPNYLHNFERSGFTKRDTSPPGSDRLVDAMAAYEADDSITARIAAHRAAGADQVVLQLLGRDAAEPVNGYTRLALAAGVQR